MQYSFNSKIAEIYGVDGAIMLENLYFWINKNKANERHFHDDKYWTYNSMKAFTKLFPFWTHRQIERILKNLEKSGAIITGNYNKSSYDHTRWYALTETVKAIYVNGEINLTKSVNQINQNVKPIPDNKQQIINTYNKKKKNTTKLDDIINSYGYNEELKETLRDFIKMRATIKKPITDRAMRLLVNRLNKLSSDEAEQLEILNQSILNSWQSIYPLKESNISKKYVVNEDWRL